MSSQEKWLSVLSGEPQATVLAFPELDGLEFVLRPISAAVQLTQLGGDEDVSARAKTLIFESVVDPPMTEELYNALLKHRSHVYGALLEACKNLTTITEEGFAEVRKSFYPRAGGAE